MDKFVYVVTDGDLFDYDAPAPSGIFSTREEALSAINSSIYFTGQINKNGGYRLYFSSEYYYLYKYPLGKVIENTKDVEVEKIISYGEIIGMNGIPEMNDWRP